MTTLNKQEKNRLEIKFTAHLDANKFIHSDISNKYDINVFIPYHHIQVIGIIRGLDTELTEDEIKTQIKMEEKYEILNVFRFSRKHYTEQGDINCIPTQTVKITFRAQQLPKRVYIYFTTSEVEPYRILILQCRNCQKYGHYSKFCSNPTVCLVCAGNHPSQECTSKVTKCHNCSLPHKANSTTCLIHQSQEQIRNKMQEFNLTYREAREVLQGKISYAQ